jgi:predicted component of type VI protein secretion system
MAKMTKVIFAAKLKEREKMQIDNNNFNIIYIDTFQRQIIQLL